MTDKETQAERDLADAVKAYEDQVANWTKIMGQVKQKVDDLKSQHTIDEDEITRLSGQVQSLTGQLSTAQAKANTADSFRIERDRWKTDYDTQRSLNDSLTSQLASANASLSASQLEIQKLKAAPPKPDPAVGPLQRKLQNVSDFLDAMAKEIGSTVQQIVYFADTETSHGDGLKVNYMRQAAVKLGSDYGSVRAAPIISGTT